jgi:hypothetical protein
VCAVRAKSVQIRVEFANKNGLALLALTR